LLKINAYEKRRTIYYDSLLFAFSHSKDALQEMTQKLGWAHTEGGTNAYAR